MCQGSVSASESVSGGASPLKTGVEAERARKRGPSSASWSCRNRDSLSSLACIVTYDRKEKGEIERGRERYRKRERDEVGVEERRGERVRKRCR